MDLKVFRTASNHLKSLSHLHLTFGESLSYKSRIKDFKHSFSRCKKLEKVEVDLSAPYTLLSYLQPRS